PAADKETNDCQQDAGYPMVTIEPLQLGKAPPITDRVPMRRFRIACQNPANVGPPHAVSTRRVGILRSVGIAVVMQVMGSPPKRPLLQGTTAQASQEKLKRPARLVGPVREIAMIAGRDAKHACEIKEAAEHHGQQVHSSEKDRNTGYV